MLRIQSAKLYKDKIKKIEDEYLQKEWENVKILHSFRMKNLQNPSLTLIVGKFDIMKLIN